MKTFDKHSFSISDCKKEIVEFENLLKANPTLDENSQVLPFFKKSRNLCALFRFITHPETPKELNIAHEFDLWGDFQCDFAISDSENKYVCLIEFEDCSPESIFKKVGKKITKEYAPRFEHGYSQIIDWLCRIDGFRNTKELKNKFGRDSITYAGILVTGHSRDLDESLTERLSWRQQNVTVSHSQIFYFTFDQLLNAFKEKIENVASDKVTT